MVYNISSISIVSDVSFVEQLSSEPSPQRNNSTNILYSTELSATHTREVPTRSSVTSPKSDFVTPDDNSIDPTFPNGFGAQQLFTPPSLNDLNLSPSPLHILAAFTVVQHYLTHHDDKHSPQSPEPSEPSPISTPSMNLSTNDSWKFHIPQQMTTPSIRRMNRGLKDLLQLLLQSATSKVNMCSVCVPTQPICWRH